MPPQTTVRLQNLRSDLTLDQLRDFFRGKYTSADVDNISLCRQFPTSESPQVATVTISRTDQFYKAQKQKQYQGLGAFHPGNSKRSVNVDVDFLGFTVLYDGEPTRAPVVDFIFLHGLNGHAFRTFSCVDHDGAITMWPRDFLKHNFPQSRIMTYGYNANVFKETSLAVREDFKNALLASLSALRMGTSAATRPIIFVGHSLGGLVIKAALLASTQKRVYLQIQQSTKGVVFFGTPHLGSKFPELAKSLHKIATVAFWNERPPIKLIESLTLHSTELTTLHENWLAICNHYSFIISCYECRPMPIKGVLRFVQSFAPIVQELVVDKPSATVGLSDKEHLLPRQNCDHSQVCRYIDSVGEEYFNLVHFLKKGLTSDPYPDGQSLHCYQPSNLDLNSPSSSSILTNASPITESSTLFTSATMDSRSGPSAELKYIILSFDASVIAEKFSCGVKFFNEDALYLPPVCRSSELLDTFEAKAGSARSFDETYLRQLANEYRDSREDYPKYDEFANCCGEFLTALGAAGDVAKATFVYLWLLSRILGRPVMQKVYNDVIISPKVFQTDETLLNRPSRPSATGLHQQTLDKYHKAIQLLMSITDGAYWTSFDDSKADYGVNFWCDIEQGEHIDVCKNPLGYLHAHEKVLLPATQRDLWLAENLSRLFGIGAIVENAEEERRALQRSSLLWRLDPADDTLDVDFSSYKDILRYLDPTKDLSFLDKDSSEPEDRDSDELRAVPTHERKADFFGIRNSQSAVERYIVFLRTILERCKADPDSIHQLEEELSIRLVAGDLDRGEGDNFRQQVFFSLQDENRMLQFASGGSFWLRRYLKAAFTFNRAIILCRQPTVRWNLKHREITDFNGVDILPLYDLGSSFTLDVGPVKWHRRVGSHSGEAKWDCLQVGRLLWDIPAKAMLEGWKQICQRSDMLAVPSLTAVDCVMILAFQAAIGLEYLKGHSVPIPIFEECFQAPYWQQILPTISDGIQIRTKCGEYDLKHSIEEAIPPCGHSLLDTTEENKPATVLLVDRVYLHPVSSVTADAYGVKWENFVVDLHSVLATEKQDLRDFNVVVYDGQGRIHNFAIGRNSNLANRLLLRAEAEQLKANEQKSIDSGTPYTINTWSEIHTLLGLQSLETPSDAAAVSEAKQIGEAQESKRGEDQSHSSQVARSSIRRRPVPSSAHAAERRRIQEMPGYPSVPSKDSLYGHVSSSLETYERSPTDAFVLKLRHEGRESPPDSLPRSCLDLVVLPHFLEKNQTLYFQWESYQTLETDLLSFVVDRVREWIKDEEYVEFRSFNVQSAAYFARFGHVEPDESKWHDPETYLKILEECLRTRERFVDHIVLGLVSERLDESLLIFEEDFNIDGALKLILRNRYPSAKSLTRAIWLLKRDTFTYELLVPSSARDIIPHIELSDSLHLDQEDLRTSDDHGAPSAYVFMLGMAMMFLYGTADDPDTEEVIMKAWGRAVLATWSHGLTVAQEYYLSHGDFFEDLQQIARPEQKQKPEPSRQGCGSSMEPLNTFEEWRVRALRSMKASDSAKEKYAEGKRMRSNNEIGPAMRAFAQAMDDCLSAMAAGSTLVQEELAIIGFDSARELVSITMKGKMFEAAFAYLGVAKAIAAMFLDSDVPQGQLGKYELISNHQLRQLLVEMRGIREEAIAMIQELAWAKTEQILANSAQYHEKTIETLVAYVERNLRIIGASTSLSPATAGIFSPLGSGISDGQRLLPTSVAQAGPSARTLPLRLAPSTAPSQPTTLSLDEQQKGGGSSRFRRLFHRRRH